jgi:hypothetical protein
VALEASAIIANEGEVVPVGENLRHHRASEAVSHLELPSIFIRVSSCDFVDRPFVGRNERSTKSHELKRTKSRRVLTQALKSVVS